jgi:hypothetical protein
VRSCSSLSSATQFLRFVEQGLVFGEFGGGEAAGDGSAADFAGPLGVGAVEAGRVGVAAAPGFAACVGADGEGAGQGRMDQNGGRFTGCWLIFRREGCAMRPSSGEIEDLLNALNESVRRHIKARRTRAAVQVLTTAEGAAALWVAPWAD